jgi:hypothetical protein
MKISCLVLAALMSVPTLPLASRKEASIRQIDFKNFTFAWDETM